MLSIGIATHKQAISKIYCENYISKEKYALTNK